MRRCWIPRLIMVAAALLPGSCNLLLLGQAPAASTTANPLQITTRTLPDGLVNESYEAKLAGAAGLPAYVWILDPQSKLPPGLILERNGLITGTPTAPGEFAFTVQLRDQGAPTGWVQREFKITILTAFAVQWRKLPAVQNDRIVGEVVVFNHVVDPVDLTVIVVAVNDVGKAFVLGYDRFELPARSESKVVPFGASLPNGRYVVHVDAIGEVPKKNRIYRARQQTPRSLEVSSR